MGQQVSRKVIREGFAPLSRALLREGKPTAEATIAGFHVKAVRQRNLHVCYGGMSGAVWNPLYIIEGVGSGSRDDMENCIWHRANRAKAEAAS